MRRLSKITISALMLLSIILSPLASVISSGALLVYDNSENSGTRNTVANTLEGTDAEAYYKGSYSINSLYSMSRTELLSALRKLMTSTHSYISSYNNCRDYAHLTDSQNKDDTIILLYSSYVATHDDYIGSGSIGWNREHVWPKNLGGFETDGAGGDLHHIRPDDAKTNSDRSNKKYGNVNGGTASYTNLTPKTLGGYYNSSYYEPLDNVKGDVARICLYVYARWGEAYNKCSNITNVFESVDVLLEWCEMDPVDTWEMGRNEVVAEIQGNRNVFIDYPELAWKLFGKEVPSDMVTPSGLAMSSTPITPNPQDPPTPTDPPTPPVCEHKNTEIKDYKAPTCNETGYSGDTYCTDCNNTVSWGAGIPATDNHAYGNWLDIRDSGSISAIGQFRQCTACGKTETKMFCRHTSTVVKNTAPATCTKNGYSGDTYCAECDELISEGVATDKLTSHTYAEWAEIKPATEASVGFKKRVCKSCGNEEVETLPKLTAGNNAPAVIIIAASISAVALISAIAVVIIVKKRR